MRLKNIYKSLQVKALVLCYRERVLATNILTPGRRGTQSRICQLWLSVCYEQIEESNCFHLPPPRDASVGASLSLANGHELLCYRIRTKKHYSL
jgi:hypothetical protein